MSERPRAAPALLSAVVGAVPPRLVKKLDQNPRAADAWTWTTTDGAVTVTTDGGETVRLVATEGIVGALDGGGCTCLLSPRCFHLLAVVAALGVDEDAVALPPVAAAPAEERAGEDVSAAERTAATVAWEAAARIVAGGASAAGAVVQGDLLRAAHGARAEGLHRLGAAAVRVVRHVRALRAAGPEFTLDDLCADLDDLLATAWAIRHAPTLEATWRGVARRAYDVLGGLRLVGLFAEPIVAGGYAGVITYVCDDRGRIFTSNEVLPGDADRARSAYDAAVRMGDTSIAHRALVREGLLMEGATASRDLRLGAGAGVKAVRSGPTSATDAAVTALWEASLGTQVARAYAALEQRRDERPAAATLVFVRGTVLGREDASLVLRSDAGALLRIAAPSSHEALSYRDNLRLLASAPGLPLRIAGHLVPERAGTLAGVAALVEDAAPVGPGPGDAPALVLPPAWGGRVCLGLDRLQGAHLVGAGRAPVVEIPGTALDPLAPVRRRVQRLALGGRATLGAAAVRSVEHERALLAKRLLATASAALGALVAAALDRREDLARAWLAASTYERTATRAIQCASWRA